MKTMKSVASLAVWLALVLALAGCATNQPYDYSNFRAHPPRSILVLPPVNESTDTRGTYGYLSTVTAPLAEKGYYVFPIVEVDELMKENGLPSAGEMQQVPLNKLRSIIGADAVLYVTLKQYGTDYQLISSSTVVTAEGKLVDASTGLTLWEGTASVTQSSGSSSSGNPLADLVGDLVAAAVHQIVGSSTDHAHEVSRLVNAQLFMAKDKGLLDGPYNAASPQPAPVAQKVADQVAPASSLTFADGAAAYKRADYQTALAAWKPLAEEGNVMAENGLGVLYEYGYGLAQDSKAAEQWLAKAAFQGSVQAGDNLGWMYEQGYGVKKDGVRAFMWYSLAAGAASGDDGRVPAGNLARVSSQLSEAEIARAKKLAAACQKASFAGCG